MATAKRRKIKRGHQHILVYLALAGIPAVVYLVTAGSHHIPAVQTNIDVGLSFFDWLMDRLMQSADKLTALAAATLALVYTLKIISRK